MQTGTKISGIAHAALIAWLLFGGLPSRPKPFEVAEVSLFSEEEYAALTAPRAESPADAPDEDAPAAPAPEPEASEAAEEQPPARPEAAPEAPPEAEESEAPPAPEPPEASTALPDPISPRPNPRPADRVAPTPVAPPPPDALTDQETRDEVSPEDGGETEAEAQEQTAPEEASDRIVPETTEPPSRAPEQSLRPPSRRPEPPRVAEQPVPERAPPEEPRPATPEPEPEPEPDRSSGAINDALAEAMNDAGAGSSSGQSAPSGPPLTGGEKEGLRVAVSACWNVGSLSTDALATTVVVGVNLNRDGTPDAGSIRLLSHSGGSSSSAQDAFGAARRAIIRCGASGFDLPAEKYDHWREIEMTFNPERMRIK